MGNQSSKSEGNFISDDDYIKEGIVFIGKDWNGYSYPSCQRGGTTVFGGKTSGDCGILPVDEFLAYLKQAINNDKSRNEIPSEEAVSRVEKLFLRFTLEDRLVTAKVIEKVKLTSSKNQRDEDRIKEGLNFIGENWNGYSYPSCQEGGVTIWGGKTLGDCGILPLEEFLDNLNQAIRRDESTKEKVSELAIQSACDQIREIMGENKFVTRDVIRKFKESNSKSRHEDNIIKEGLIFLGEDWNGYSYPSNQRGATTIWGGKSSGDCGVLLLEEFLANFNEAIRQDESPNNKVSDKAIQRANDQIRTLVGEDGLVTGEVILRFKNLMHLY